MNPLRWVSESKAHSLIGLALLLLLPVQVLAAPGTIWFQDNFERSNPGSVGNGWVVTPVANVNGGAIDCTGATGNTGCAGIDGDVPPWNVATNPSANPTNSMFTRWNGVYVTTPAINLSTAPAAQLTYWLRRGSDCFSEWPGNQMTGCTYTATITVTGNTSTSVSGITINGTQIMSGASTANTNQNTVASNIAAKINVAGSGFTATAASNVVTITGANMNAYSALPIIAQVGTMTLATNFSPAYTPNYGEEFEVQYLNSANTWVNLKKYAAEGPPGEEFRPVVLLPGDALWSGFKVRFYQPSGSGSNWTGFGAPNVLGTDYWHIDDVVVTELAATSYTGSFCDNFEGGLSRWTVAGFGDANQGSTYFQNGAHDLDLRWDAVTVTSMPSDMTAATGTISFWVKRGTGAATVPNVTGSDFPETGKNLLFQYLNTSNNWVTLATFNGGGTAGQIYCPTVGTNCPVATPTTNSFPLTSLVNPKLSAFQLRFSFTGTGTGYDYDYWHVDDVCLGTPPQPTDLALTIAPTGTTQVNPGATSVITLTVTNNGPNVELGNITVIDTTPAGATPPGLILNTAIASTWSDGTMLPGATNACTAIGQVITCTRVGSLAAGASTTLTLQVKAAASATGSGLLNTATVSGQSNDTNLSNNTAQNYYSFDPSPFDAYETNTAANAISGKIYTKLAGTAFNLDVIAISAGAIKTSYTGTVTVELVDGAAVCASATALTGVTVSPASYTYTTGTGKDNGTHIFSFTSSSAYSNVKVRVRDTVGAVGCSADKFAIRPSVFTITSSANNNNTTGASIKAGAAFTLNAASVAGYNGTPVVDNTAGKVLGSPNAGTIAGVFTAAPVGTGTATGAGFTYSEVGNFGLAQNAVYDSTFTTVDQTSDCVATAGLNFSNTMDANGKYGCSIGSIGVPQTTGSSGFGRFIPDHFHTEIVAVSGVPMACPTALTCPSNLIGAMGMVYSGQTYSVKVTAINSANGTTTNYQGVYDKTATLSAWNTAGGATANPGGGALATVATSAFALGIATPTQKYTLPTYATTPAVGPTDFYIRAVDTDSVTSNVVSPVEAGLKVAYGQVKVSNAYGSELLPLTLTATAQYYSATGWTTSLTDASTNLVFAASYTVGTGSTTPSVTPSTGTMNNGKLSIKLSKPGVKGVATINPTLPSYLPLTPGTATFGIYAAPGGDSIIYQREAY